METPVLGARHPSELCILMVRYPVKRCTSYCHKVRQLGPRKIGWVSSFHVSNDGMGHQYSEKETNINEWNKTASSTLIPQDYNFLS